jgi:prolyl oligopeptidase
MPFVIAQPGSDHVVLMLENGVARAMRLFVAPLDAVVAGKANWLPVATSEDSVEGFALMANDMYMLRKDRPRGRVVKTSALRPALASATEVVPESDVVINTVAAAKDGIYVVSRGTKGVGVRVLAQNGTLRSVSLPFFGITYNRFATTASDGLYMYLENAVTPRMMLHVTGTKATDTGLAPKAAFPTDQYVSEAVEVTARDGAKVPFEIFYKKGTARDGKRAALISAYGAYGIDNDVPFSPYFTSFLDQGMVIGIAHVRGGGELGNDWRLAGKDAAKPNTWRDAIDTAEYLIDAGWTSKRRISLFGASAGGIMAGGAANERPELWAAIIAQVGTMNALRVEYTPNGETNIPEFGSVKTPGGFRALKAMDAYHNIKAGVAYPPMLLTAGLNDPRVTAWQPAKYVARMQAASTGGPVIFMVHADEGHGVGSSQSQAAEGFADMGAFVLWAAERAGNGKK